jgi:hypothetical protein
VQINSYIAFLDTDCGRAFFLGLLINICNLWAECHFTIVTLQLIQIIVVASNMHHVYSGFYSFHPKHY